MGFLTTDCCMLFQVFPAQVDVFDQALAGVRPALLHRVFGTQREHGQVLQRQTQSAQTFVQLLGEGLSHLVALVLRKTRGLISSY